jgi:hypothetical protein
MGTPTVIPVWFGGVTGVSNVVDISDVAAVVGLIMPPDWTPAVMSIEGSADGVAFHQLYEGRSPARTAFNVPPGAMVVIDPSRLRCCKALRLISGDPAKPTPQGEAREFGLIVEMA